MRLIALVLVFALMAQPQTQQPANNQGNPGFTISVSSNLVVVNVDVRDRSGNPMAGLKASDFTLTEDGKAQRITVFDYQKLESAPSVPLTPLAGAAVAPANATSNTLSAPRPAAAKAITPSKPGEVRYKDRRLLVLFFDMSSMPPEDQIRSQQAALKFIDTQITPSDVVSIMSFSNKLNVVQDFTEDREALRGIVSRMRVGEASELSALGATGSDADTDTGDAFSADDTEFNVFNTDRKLGALESAVKMLGSLPEKKALVYFSSGIGKTGVENQSQLRATTAAAVRANVSFYPIDSRGLMATAPGGNANTASARGAGLYSGAAQASRRGTFNDQQETLTTLAADTGGKALLDTNDLGEGIVQAQRDISSYYILGYYSSNPAQDGRYRKIQVKLNPTLQAKVNYRAGYFAGKQFKDFNSADKERQLEEAILLGDPITELPLAMEINYFRMGKASFFVPVAVKIPGSAIELNKRGDRGEIELDFIGQVRDAKGQVAAAVRDALKVKIDANAGSNLTNRNLEYDSGFTLGPGDYTLKFLARENQTGKIGTFETKFNVPDLSGDSKQLKTSSVVWANQRENLSSAVATAEKNKKLLATHPLVQDNQKLIPSITRVYRRGQSLFVYLEVYDPSFTPEKSVDILASLSFYSGAKKVFQSDPVRVSQPAPKRPQAVPVQFEIPLARLQPGRYTCQVNLIDEVGQKFAFSRAPMVLVN